ncbi:MAG: hypothetical protein NW226_09195 [Microscillaceae bacterium]|nr:hypothetical protein [Microscillaceae bacterium]
MLCFLSSLRPLPSAESGRFLNTWHKHRYAHACARLGPLPSAESGHFQEYLAQAPLRSCLRQVIFFYLVPILAPDGGISRTEANF